MNSSSKTFKIAMGGICLALALIFLFGATVVPGIELTLFALASLFTAVMIIETGVGGGIVLFAAACILGLVLIPNKVAMVPYIFLFGYYPVIKYFFEKAKSGILQITFKAIYFAAASFIGFFAFKSLLVSAVDFPELPTLALALIAILMLMLYDFVMTFLINWYITRFKGRDSTKFKLS